MRFIIVLTCLLGTVQLSLSAEDTDSTNTFTLWQLPEQTPSQMMSYVIQTANGKVIVIDGGTKGDAPYLKGFLAALGNKVELWIISHMHLDHVDALNELLTMKDAPEVKEIYTTLPEMSWLETHCNIGTPGMRAPDSLSGLLEGANKKNIPIRDATMGEEFNIDGIHFKVFGIINPEITSNAVNNSSLVWRMWDDHKSVLFTGDIGVEAGNKILAGSYREALPSDYVQMAHHGQTGASEEFYTVVNPQYCLWPTPSWLWDNNNGGGKDSGPWKTLEVRAWMNKLDIKEHYVSKDGLHKIK